MAEPSLEIMRKNRRFEIELFDAFFDKLSPESRETKEAELVREFKHWLVDAR